MSHLRQSSSASNTTTSHPSATNKKSWAQAMQAYQDKRAVIMLFLGFSAGIPILLIFSSLSLWLREAGVERGMVTMFSWAALGYSFKFIWSPLVDALPIPFLTKLLGRRRAWLLVAQGLIITAILVMASIDPSDKSMLKMMALGAVLLGFSSATQDIVIDAYRIELAAAKMQSVLSATYSAGYRIGMIVAGAGALYLADFFGSTEKLYSYTAWRDTYWIMACVMGVGVATTLLSHEPQPQLFKTDLEANKKLSHTTQDYLRILCLFLLSVMGLVFTYIITGKMLPTKMGVFLDFLLEAVHLFISVAVAITVGYSLVMLNLVKKHVAYVTWVEPVVEFFKRYGKQAILLLLLIGLYRISDIVAGVISNVFYDDMGFSKTDIATAVKTFGVLMVIIGGFLGGILTQKMRIMRAMMIGGILASLSHLMFTLLALRGHDIVFMYLAVAVDNLASGLQGAVFIAFLSALTNIRFTAVQYALFSSLMTLFPKVLGGYSGTIVNHVGYPWFFVFTTVIGFPVLYLVYLVDKKMNITAETDANTLSDK